MSWNDTFTPRHFQAELINATEVRAVAGESTTLGLVWPGSGKTLAYQGAATQLMREDLIDYVAVYAPRLTLAHQAELGWRHVGADGKDVGAFASFDARCRLERLRHRDNRPPLLPPGVRREGFVTTYQSLVTDPNTHREWAEEHRGRFLLVGDEAQFLGAPAHGSDGGSPRAGQYFESMAQYAKHTLLLSGTADRADGRPLVLCDRYYQRQPSGLLKVFPDVSAGYENGISHDYLRRFDALLHECRIAWHPDNKERLEYDLSASHELPAEKRAALAVVLRRESVWQPMCDLTVKRLRLVQETNPRYRALIACMEQQDAKQVVRYLRRRYPGLRVTIAISEDGAQAEQALRDFKCQPYDVLVTVRKAFIGYDLPEITVVCVLTNYRHPGHIIQLTFRGGRVWARAGEPAERQRLHLIVPDDPPMQEIISYLRTEENKGLRLRQDIICGGGGGPKVRSGYLEDAQVTGVRGATNDHDMSASDFAANQQILDELGPINTPEQMRALLDKLNVAAPAAQPAALPPRPTGGTPKTDRETVKHWKGQASLVIGQYLRACGHSPDDHDYPAIRARLTRDLNESFESGIKSTDDLTTAVEAEKYLRHVQSTLARRGGL